MVDQISPIHQHSLPSGYDLTGEPKIFLEETTTFSLYQFSGWPETMEQTANEVIKFAATSNAPNIGKIVVGDHASMMRVEPLKYWVISDKPGLDFMALPQELCCSLDLSHSRAWIKISGSKTELLLNHFLPIDLRPDKFLEKDVVNTAFHHVGVTLWRTEEYFNLLIPRSFAASLWELLTESAMQYGVKIVNQEKTTASSKNL